MKKVDIKSALLGTALASLMFTLLAGCVVYEPYPDHYYYRDHYYYYGPYYYDPYYYRYNYRHQHWDD